MASPRQSSPSMGDQPSPSPSQLTPRSKVKAMLAAMEDDSSNVPIQENDDLATPQTPSRRPRTVRDAANTDDEDAIVRPRGRLAARMQGEATVAVQAPDESNKSPLNARDRVRQMLARSRESLQRGAEAAGSSEDDIPPIRTRRRESPASLRSSPHSVRSSPGLFVSPAPSRSRSLAGSDGESELDLPINAIRNERFMALVQKKREERLAKEAEMKKQKAQREAERTRLAASQSNSVSDVDGISDDDADKALTQQSRPTRKASKKALEEMERETQRMSRNMQLAHQARTKKKITRASLFAKFNYKPAGHAQEDTLPEPSSSSPRLVEGETPPSSPPSRADEAEKRETLMEIDDAGDTGVPEISQVDPPADKGKGKAIEEPAETKSTVRKISAVKLRSPTSTMIDLDSDSELDIVTKTPRRAKIDAIFDNIPAKKNNEPHSLQALRVLAHLTSPKNHRRRKEVPSITASELQTSLQRRARQQALQERDERIQALRERGVIVLTTEEREKEIAEVENLLEKARQEGEEIMRRERDAEKKTRRENGDADDSADDGDWEGSDAMLSGSEDEDEEDIGHDLVDGEASESDEDEESAEEVDEVAEAAAQDVDMNDEEDDLPMQRSRRRKTIAISDDEDDVDVVMESPAPQHKSPLSTDSPKPPNSVLRSATKTFIPGLTVKGPVGLGLTQIFAGTMDESQVEDSVIPTLPDPAPAANDSMAFLRRLPAPALPTFEPTMDESSGVVADSQTPVPRGGDTQADTQGIPINFSQSQIHGFDSLLDDPATQLSDFPDATQDVGFQYNSPIARFRDEPPSTSNTVRKEQSPSRSELGSPVVRKKGRLRQRARATSDEIPNDDEFEITPNVFDAMRKAARQKPVENFDKSKSKAKEMVHEQAEESEDEYAGLGGASDDSDGEEDEYVKQMIDDNGNEVVDERKLAAFFADKERANHERQLEKLYKDITSGALRRKRGADYGLSDSDDDGEARRRRKRREFAKMRKALLADERLGKIAENPKKLAFMRAVEDRDDDDSIDFLDEDVEEEPAESPSQSQTDGLTHPLRVPDSQPENPAKRKQSTESDEPAPRLPPNLRRTNLIGSKPANLAELRKSVSALVEDRNSGFQQEPASEGEDEEEHEDDEAVDKENYDPFAPRRRLGIQVVDRISLKRNSSSASSSTRMAFGVGSRAADGSSVFKVPALLRRATTNSSVASASSTSSLASLSSGSSGTGGSAKAAGASSMGAADGVARKPTTKNGGVNFFARENERRAKLAQVEKRRNEKRWEGAANRRRAVGGLFGGGKFE